MRYTYPRDPGKSFRMLHEFPAKYHASRVAGSWHQSELRFKYEFRKLTGPGHDCGHLHDKYFLLCHNHESAASAWTPCSANTTGSPWRLQRQSGLEYQSFCHPAKPLGSLPHSFIHSAIISSSGMGGGCVCSLRMTEHECSLSSICDAVTKCGILLPALQKATKRPAS